MLGLHVMIAQEILRRSPTTKFTFDGASDAYKHIPGFSTFPLLGLAVLLDLGLELSSLLLFGFTVGVL